MGRFDFNNIIKVPLHDRVFKDAGHNTTNNTNDLPLGTIVTDNRNGKKPIKRYVLVEAPKPGSCKGCDLYIDRVCWRTKKLNCSAYSRLDKTWVILKEVHGSTK